MRRQLALAGILVAIVAGCSSGADEAAATTTDAPEGLSADCEAAIEATVAELGEVLDSVELGNIERGAPLPDVGASLPEGCTTDDAPEMWTELITQTWVGASDGSDERTAASVVLVTEMCDLAAGIDLSSRAVISCSLAELIDVTAWNES